MCLLLVWVVTIVVVRSGRIIWVIRSFRFLRPSDFLHSVARRAGRLGIVVKETDLRQFLHDTRHAVTRRYDFRFVFLVGDGTGDAFQLPPRETGLRD